MGSHLLVEAWKEEEEERVSKGRSKGGREGGREGGLTFVPSSTRCGTHWCWLIAQVWNFWRTSVLYMSPQRI